MNEQVLREHYNKRGYSDAKTEEAVTAVRELQSYLEARLSSLESAGCEEIRIYITDLIHQEKNTLEILLALARYFYLTGRNEIYVYFTSLLGGIGVVESIQSRLGALISPGAAQEMIGSVAHPPLGTDPVDFPAFTRALMERLEQSLPQEIVRTALAGNNHQIPAEAFEEDAALYRNSDSVEAFLRAKHAHQVQTLQHHCDTGTVWFEQIITQEVVDFVASNQEIQSAVIDGNILYTTKIPYDPVRYLSEADPVKKRYYACHCPFVREAILRNDAPVSGNWCYCSAGFAKYPYEVLLCRPLRVDVVESVLDGGSACRFAIHLPEEAIKKEPRS